MMMIIIIIASPVVRCRLYFSPLEISSWYNKRARAYKNIPMDERPVALMRMPRFQPGSEQQSQAVAKWKPTNVNLMAVPHFEGTSIAVQLAKAFAVITGRAIRPRTPTTTTTTSAVLMQ